MLSLPWSLRYQLAFDAALCRDVLAVFIRVVFGWVRRRAWSKGLRDGQCGAITVIQCFGSSLNLNVHIHSLVLVFTRSLPTAAPVFHALPAPTDAEVPPAALEFGESSPSQSQSLQHAGWKGCKGRRGGRGKSHPPRLSRLDD